MRQPPKQPPRPPSTSEPATQPPPTSPETVPPKKPQPEEPATVTAAPVSRPGERGATPPRELPASFGRYRLVKLLGQGGMGAVYLAHDTQLDRPVALKMPHFTADDGPQVLARFYREARSAATVTHPNICPVYEIGEIDGLTYLAMAFIEGKSLAEFARTKPLTPRQAAMLVRKLALALQEAHKRGVIHRDLKPANIMIDKRGEPVVMDFGLARRTRRGDPRLTQKGDMMGTPAYMPPEQVSGDVDAMGPACDIYSLGVILYELLAGRLPFSGDSMAMLSQVLLDEPPPPSKFRPDLDPELEAICKKMMAKKVEGRYSSMAELAAALTDYLRGKTMTPERTATMAPTAAPVRPTEAAIQVEDVHVIQSDDPRSTALSFADLAKDTMSGRKPRRTRQRKAEGRSVPAWLWLIGAAGVGLLLLLGWTIYRVTDYGTIIIDVNESAESVELIVDNETGHRPGDSFRLRAGENHFVEVTGADYETVVHGFTVHRGDNPALHVSLKPKFGTVRLALSDPNAPVQVHLDGAAAPVPNPGQPLRLPIGEHHLRVNGPDYEEVQQTFIVHAGENSTLPIVLHPKTDPPKKETSESVNVLTAREKADGWKLLFDGTTTNGWRGYNRLDIPDRWRVEDGALILRPQPGTSPCDLVSAEEYDNFVLTFQWKISPGGNSGVLYRVAERPAPPYATGPEYQIIDNAKNNDGRRPETSAASCYNLYGPLQDATKPAGEWNEARILVNGNHVEHWLNGIKVVEYELGSPDWQRRVQATKFKDMPGLGKEAKGHIDLQDHNEAVAYRNLKILPLKRPREMAPGLVAELFQGRNFEHKVQVRIDRQVNGQWFGSPDRNVVPPGPFSIRWTGWLQAPESGHYKLIASVDDGVRLWLDGRLLMDQWFQGGGKRIEAEVDLTAGRHALRLDYFEFGAGPSVMKLHWQKQGSGEQVVPAEALFHHPDAYQRIADRLPEEEERFYSASKPKDTFVYLLKADAYYAKHNYDRALGYYVEWLRLALPKPDRNQESAEYYNNRAWQMATGREASGRFGEIAVGLARRACLMTEWKNWIYLDTLAAAYADAGHFDQAVRWQTQALKLLTDAKRKPEIQSRLSLYRTKRPYRQPVPK